MSIIVNDIKRDYVQGMSVFDLVNKENKDFFCCKVDNKVKDLFYKISDNSKIELLGLNDEDSIRVYEASIRYLILMAIERVFPFLSVTCDYYVSRSISFKKKEGIFSLKEVQLIEEEVRKIVAKDFVFARKTISVDEAKKSYLKAGLSDKVEILDYKDKGDEAHVYYCDNYFNYMYSYMVPSSGYLRKYKILLYKGMIIVQYPRAEEGGKIPEFIEEKSYEETLNEATEWEKKVNALTVGKINKKVINNSAKEFILQCEKRHQDSIMEVTQMIVSSKKIKLIAIAGPSSSGKTTFSNKLRIELEKKNIFPVKISMDDYYKDRSNFTKEEEECLDLEDMNLIDIKLFNEHLKALTEGEKVELPKFDFSTKKRIKGSTIQLLPNSPIIIEGIHALNEKLTSSLTRANKFEIYIGPHIQINLDDHNPISITNLRLIRRLVRDYNTRGSDIEETLSMWDSVRKGEFKWIYENQEGVDYVYNSALNYEFGVMKKYAIPLLRQVSNNSTYYNLSKSLIKYLKYFVDIKDSEVPSDSLLREFIGGSCFEENH